MKTTRFFPTLIHTGQLKQGATTLTAQLLREVEDLATLDKGGIAWSKKNYRNGFTSYASANELQRMSPTFQKLEKWIDKHVMAYARDLDFDLQGGKLEMTNCWANLMNENTHHSMHIHPLAVISGTFYVSMPSGAPAIKFEDPRAALFMHSPPRRENCARENKTYVEVKAKAGSLVLFESWIRHEVPMHRGSSPRVSISFNYDWK